MSNVFELNAPHAEMMPLLPAFTAAPFASVQDALDRVYCADGIALMNALPPQSIDAIITDLPYGITACSWDEIIPFAPMWEAVKRVLKPRGVFVTTASQPFTSKLVMSNLAWFKYEWVWNKAQSGNVFLADSQPLKIHENVLVFGLTGSSYYPEMRKGILRVKGGGYSKLWNTELTRTVNDDYYPVSILQYSNAAKSDTVHPTQKPVALYRYLIRTYTRPGEIVLDFCCGSGTTALAARDEQRHWIVGDTSAEYVEMARARLALPYTLPMFAEGAT